MKDIHTWLAESDTCSNPDHGERRSGFSREFIATCKIVRG